MAKVLDRGLEVCEFELQPRNCVHCRINNIGKGKSPLLPPPVLQG